jgi:hypothetical protein
MEKVLRCRQVLRQAVFIVFMKSLKLKGVDFVTDTLLLAQGFELRAEVWRSRYGRTVWLDSAAH